MWLKVFAPFRLSQTKENPNPFFFLNATTNMKANNKMTECEKQVELAKAQCKLGEYFRNDMRYSDIMELTADAQSMMMKIMAEEDRDETGGYNMASVLSFFSISVELLKLLKPIAAIEGGL